MVAQKCGIDRSTDDRCPFRRSGFPDDRGDMNRMSYFRDSSLWIRAWAWTRVAVFRLHGAAVQKGKDEQFEHRNND
jgi:hypothetical protein